MAPFFVKNNMVSKEDISKVYKILAYTENIMDLIDNLEAEKLGDAHQNIYKSCKNFKNRLFGKKNATIQFFLDSVFKDSTGGKEFNTFRDEIDKTIDFILSINSEDYLKLKAIRETNFNKDLMVVSLDELRKLVVDSRLNTLQTDKFLDQWLTKKT